MEYVQQAILLQQAEERIKIGILLDFDFVLCKRKKKNNTHQGSYCSFTAFHVDLPTTKGTKAQVGNS